MIFDFEYSNRSKNLIISEIDKNGDVKLNYYPWSRPKKYTPCLEGDPDKHTKYKTWDNKPVKLVNTNMPNRFSIYEYIDRLPEEDRNRLFEYQEPKMYFVDIETEILDTGFVEPIDANSMIQTIAIVMDRKVMVLGLKPLSNEETNSIKNRIESHFEGFDMKVTFRYLSFHDREKPEYEMMKYFMEVLVPKMPVISGWNFLNYDWTFIVNRCRILGIDPEISSPTNHLESIYMTDYEVPSHRMIIDYMEIYKKWDTSIKVKENASLNWVGGKILDMDHAAKVSYSGNLQDLYNEDFPKYVFYNAVDTVLCQLIHEKMKYIDIAYSIANLAKIRLNDFAKKRLNCTLVQTEGFLRQDFRDKKNIVMCKDDDNDTDETIPGGFVKPPNRGMNEYVACFDFASLYPTTQIQFNISPENFKGFVTEDDPKIANFNGVLNPIDEDDIICVNGAVFSRKESITINFLKDTYAKRKHNKKLMKVELTKLNELKNELSELEEELAELESC